MEEEVGREQNATLNMFCKLATARQLQQCRRRVGEEEENSDNSQLPRAHYAGGGTRARMGWRSNFTFYSLFLEYLLFNVIFQEIS